MEHLLTFDGLVSLATLSLLEIVLGIDNIVFISITTGKLPKHQQERARKIGMALALITRVLLLSVISWVIGLDQHGHKLPFTDIEFTLRDVILFAGGIFLMAKSTSEIHAKLEGTDEEDELKPKKNTSFAFIIVQIILIDIVFSFDSILTAVGLAQHLVVMVTAVVISMGIMFFFAKYVSDFVNNHPTIKMLALSFLIMIGFLLTVEAFHIDIPKEYVYFAMAFSLGVEMLNMRLRKSDENKNTDYPKLNNNKMLRPSSWRFVRKSKGHKHKV